MNLVTLEEKNTGLTLSHLFKCMIASNLIKPQILRISLKGSKCIYGIFRQKYCL